MHINPHNDCRICSHHWVKLPLHPTFSKTQHIILLTARSGTGYIGSFTALALLDAGYKVVIVDNLYNSSKEVINRIELISGKRPEFYQLDIQDEAALDKVFKEHPDIDNVIHFAALKVSISFHISCVLQANSSLRLSASLARFPSHTTA